MRTLIISTLLCCLPAVLLAAESTFKAALFDKYIKEYAKAHPNTDDEPECTITNEEDLVTGPLNAIVDRSKLWTDNTLYYEIQDAYTDDEVTKIRAAVADLQTSTKYNGNNCIRIVESSTAPNRVVIRDCGGCSSYVGMIGGEQQMCLAAGCISRHGTIMHEFLHAFGFNHEQCRSDRDNYIYVNFANIRSGTERNFRKLREGVEVDLLGTRYDYGSVLHYGAYGFAVDRSIPTIIPLDPNATIGQRVKLSDTDIERVQLLYSCKRAADSLHFKHLAGIY